MKLVNDFPRARNATHESSRVVEISACSDDDDTHTSMLKEIKKRMKGDDSTSSDS